MEHPLTRGIDIDAPETVLVHRKIIESKPVMKFVYDAWYRSFLPAVEAVRPLGLPMMELGCGASHLERYIPEIIKTDVVTQPNAHRAMDGEHLDFPDGGLGAIFMVGVLHHIAHPERFLSEAARCLAPGGRLVMVEPSNSPLHQFMIKHFHPHEYFDGSVKDWTNTPTGRLSAANNAIPWIIFERDHEKFERMFPQLKLIGIKRHTFISYYASGGMSYRSFVPSFALWALRLTELLAGPFNRWTGTMMTIDVKKI